MGVSEDLASALLLKNEWNSDLAIKKFVEDYNYISKTFNFEIGAGQIPDNDEITCDVCFCDYSREDFVTMPDCMHGLCTFCFTAYLESKVNDGVESVLSVCPEKACKMIVPGRLFEKLL